MSTLDFRHEGAVAHVWLNRPELRNAFDAGTIADLTQCFRQLAQTPGLRVVVLGAHGKAFCAGADLNWMRDMAGYSWDENHADATRLADMLWAIASCPVPVIARVQGDCYGGGVGLVSACDTAIGTHAAGFALSEARLGLAPSTISPYVLRAIGERAARRYFLTAERFDAAQAHALGLLHEVVDADALDERVHTLVQAMVSNGPQAVRAGKQLIGDIAEATDLEKSSVRNVLEQLSQIVADALDNDSEITLPGIGKLKVSERPARTGRNPQTGKAIEIAAKKVIKLVPAKALSDSLNS